MIVSILIVCITGVFIALTVTFVGPRTDIIVPIAVIGLLALIFRAISLHRKRSSQKLAEIRRELLEEISNVSKPPFLGRLNEIAAQIGIQLDEYLDDLANGPTMDQGMKALMEQDYKTAVELFDENARTKIKEAAISWFFEGNALYFQEEYDEAIIAYRKSTSFNPGLAKAWYNWGMTLDILGLHEKANEKYEKAQELDTSPPEIENNLNPEMECDDPHQESMEKCQ